MSYLIRESSMLLTPTLAIYEELVESNIDAALRLLGNNPDRWRPHVKTSKLLRIMKMLTARKLTNFKCATTLELLIACQAAAGDVLYAVPAVAGNACRVREIAREFPHVSVSVLVDSVAQIEPFRGAPIGIFIDINPGMDRTGIPQEKLDEIVRVAAEVQKAGIRFRGLHYYEGHHNELELAKRMARTHGCYEKLLQVIASLEGAGMAVGEVVTSGTPGFPCALAFEGFRTGRFLHRVSPGTIIFTDLTSMEQLPREYGFQPAALVIATVVSQPNAGLITCNAGHKTVSVDAGIPNCQVQGRPELIPLRPSEEHLPIQVPEGVATPEIGEQLYLIPRHVCPTVNNFDHALIISGGRITEVEPVSARGREIPLATAVVR